MYLERHLKFPNIKKDCLVKRLAYFGEVRYNDNKFVAEDRDFLIEFNHDCTIKIVSQDERKIKEIETILRRMNMLTGGGIVF